MACRLVGSSVSTRRILILQLDSGLVIHVTVNLWGCRGSGLLAQIGVRTNERTAEIPTLFRRAAPCAGRSTPSAHGGLSCDGVVYEGVSLAGPSGKRFAFNKNQLARLRWPRTSGSKVNWKRGSVA